MSVLRYITLTIALAFCAVGVMAQERTFGGYAIPEDCQQVVVVSPKAEGYAVEVVTYDGEEAHREFFAPCTIGYGGTAKLGTKREGDGKSPEGVWRWQKRMFSDSLSGSTQSRTHIL